MGYFEDFVEIYAKIAEENGWGFLVFNDLNIIHKTNMVCAEMIGLKRSAILWKNWNQLVKERARGTVSEFWEGQIKCYDLVINGKEITIKQFDISIGKVNLKVQIWQNQTQNNRKRQELRETMNENELLKGILNGVFEDIAAVDKEGRLTFISNKTANTLGVDPKVVLKRPMSEIANKCLMGKVARTGVPELGKVWRVGDTHIPAIVVPLMIEGQKVGSVCRSIFRDMNDAEGFVGRLQQYFKKAQGINVEIGKTINKTGAIYTIDDIIGESDSIRRAKELAKQAAKSDASIMLAGETGTGKELFAHAVHNASGRSKKPFIKVNCASIPDSLMESELFGYEEGAFTGAKKGGKPGKFELADKGTLFLDEIGDMKLDLQAKLLRVLQEGEIEKVGQTKAMKVNVRIIAATNRHLSDMVAKGQFREDLFYRLDVIRIDIPPLRHRKKDLEYLIKNLLSTLSLKYGKDDVKISPEVLNIFNEYWWPGNVRELGNILEGAICLLEDDLINVSSLPMQFLKRIKSTSNIKVLGQALNNNKVDTREPHDNTEAEAIKHVLEITGGNKRQAAAMLGVARSTLYGKIKKYSLVNE